MHVIDKKVNEIEAMTISIGEPEAMLINFVILM